MAHQREKTWPKGTTVLIVEDSPATAHLFSARLKMEGIRVLSASNGVEALKVLHREPVSMIVTDLMMPEMDGLRLVHEIRNQDSPHKDMPILVISSKHQEAEQLDCFEAGIDDYMTKPVSLPLLVERLYRLSTRSRSAR